MIEQLLRLTGDFKGKQRLARILLSNKIRTARDEVVRAKYNCRFLVPNYVENIGFELLINGAFEEDTLKFIFDRLPADAVVLDVGANIGTIAFPLAKQRPDLRVFCFEASPRVFYYLGESQKLNQLSNCTLLNRAVSDVDDKPVSFYSPEEKFGKGSFRNVYTNNAEEVLTISLDHFVKANSLNRVDFLKVDVEGFEYLVFKGAEEMLRRPSPPDILFEFIDWAESSTGVCKAGDAQKYLISLGYRLFRVQNGSLKLLDQPQVSGDAMIFATRKVTTSANTL